MFEDHTPRLAGSDGRDDPVAGSREAAVSEANVRIVRPLLRGQESFELFLETLIVLDIFHDLSMY